MSDSTNSLRRKIRSAGDLQSVVRTMKTLAAISIGQYEKSVKSLADYYHTVEMGMGVCFRELGLTPFNKEINTHTNKQEIIAIVFGSDQGLVGQFNDVIVDYALQTLKTIPGSPKLWAVGERVHERLLDSVLPVLGLFPVPNSINGVSPLVGKILVENEAHEHLDENSVLYLFYNIPTSGASYKPANVRLLPLDDEWRNKLCDLSWEGKNLPEVVGDISSTLQALISEYLFVSIFRACAESLASENASRLAAMQRAEKNINELLDALNNTFHRLRQSDIDEELFDVISGYEALQAVKN